MSSGEQLLRVEGRHLEAPFGAVPPGDLGHGDFGHGDWLLWRPDQRPEVLARGGTALAGLYELALESGVSPLHPAAALDEARRLHAAPAIESPQLEDLRRLPFVTIDEPSSRDLDQALFIERLASGFTVYYAIADACHFVRPGTALFDEALRRGSTYYMPGLVLPMLPKSLSEDLVSLNPAVDRRALVFEIELDESGEARRCRLRRARVRSRWKTSYDEVQAFYDGGPLRAPRDASAIASSLEALRRVGQLRMELAAVRDTIRLRRRELSVRLAEDRLGFVGMADPRNGAERFNEQISLLSNVLGARLLSAPDPRLQPIFRFHRPPDEHRLARFSAQIEALVKRHRLDAKVWRWRRRHESLADFLARLPESGKGARIARAVHRQAMLAGGRAGFDTAPGIHHGVGADAYSRFTAPMREIVGIFVHKEACEHLGLEKAADSGADEELREQIVSAADRSRGLQRRLDTEVNRRLLDQLFRSDLERGGQQGHRATIMGITRTKVHAQLDDPPIDVKIYMRHLEDQVGERLKSGRDGVTVRRRRGGHAEWTVGDAVRVRAVEEDRQRNRWRLECLPERRDAR